MCMCVCVFVCVHVCVYVYVCGGELTNVIQVMFCLWECHVSNIYKVAICNCYWLTLQMLPISPDFIYVIVFRTASALRRTYTHICTYTHPHTHAYKRVYVLCCTHEGTPIGWVHGTLCIHTYPHPCSLHTHTLTHTHFDRFSVYAHVCIAVCVCVSVHTSV